MKKILFVGGGTLGPVTPLLAVARVLRRQHPDFLFAWIGTQNGPERPLIESVGIPFYILPEAKFPRHPDRRWLSFPRDWLRARHEARRLIRELKPSAVVSVGGFTAVPMVMVASSMGIPCVTHQLDVQPGLSNRQIASRCVSVTTSFAYNRPPFGRGVKTRVIATPTRFSARDLPSREEGCAVFEFDPARPVLLVFGGGTGAQPLNEWMERAAPSLIRSTQILHVTGSHKLTTELERAARSFCGYHVVSFLQEEMLHAYAAADVIVCRGGLGSFSEMATFKKSALIVPIPHSHQEINAQRFQESDAAEIVSQLDPQFDDVMHQRIEKLLNQPRRRAQLGKHAHELLPTDDGTALAKQVLDAMNRT